MGVWKMATPSKTRVNLSEGLQFLLDSIKDETEELKNMAEMLSDDLPLSKTARARIELGFAIIKSCCRMSNELFEYNEGITVKYDD
ncbi:hypothetical protein CMI47_16210 [Candidatus Pacearchaeota archaeon]|nr:hypothetical protein [Candidatus Pacearchaeota archaeon]